MLHIATLLYVGALGFCAICCLCCYIEYSKRKMSPLPYHINESIQQANVEQNKNPNNEPQNQHDQQKCG